MEKQKFTLKLTSAISVKGAILRAGELVEMVEEEAKALLRRGKAVLHEVLGEDADDKPESEGGSDGVEASGGSAPKGNGAVKDKAK